MSYAKNFKVHRILDLETNVIIESRDDEFIENIFLNDSKTVSSFIPALEDDLGGDYTPHSSPNVRHEISTQF